jgi:hypothetical protein
MPGQPQLDTNPYFGVDASELVVRDPTGGPSDYIIRRGDEFSLELTLRFGGSLAPLVLCCLCWKVCYCLDVFCADTDGGDTRPVDRTFCSPLYCAYTGELPYRDSYIVYDDGATRATVPANSLYVGTYKLTAVVRFYCRDEEHRAPHVAAFTDGPVIDIID